MHRLTSWSYQLARLQLLPERLQLLPWAGRPHLLPLPLFPSQGWLLLRHPLLPTAVQQAACPASSPLPVPPPRRLSCRACRLLLPLLRAWRQLTLLLLLPTPRLCPILLLYPQPLSPSAPAWLRTARPGAFRLQLCARQ